MTGHISWRLITDSVIIEPDEGGRGEGQQPALRRWLDGGGFPPSFYPRKGPLTSRRLF